MSIEDGKGIEVDDVVRTKGDAALFRIEIVGAEKAWTFGDRVTIDGRCRTRRAVGEVTHENIKPVDPYCSGLCVRQSLDPTGKSRPILQLLLKKLFDQFGHYRVSPRWEAASDCSHDHMLCERPLPGV